MINGRASHVATYYEAKESTRATSADVLATGAVFRSGLMLRCRVDDDDGVDQPSFTADRSVSRQL